MRKFFLISVLSMFFLYGCREESEKTTEQFHPSNNMNEKNEYSAEYENYRILEIDSGTIIIGPPVTNPEASYPAYEVFIDEKTKVEGEKKAINELTEGDKVKIWTKKESSDLEKEIAEKIVVIK